MKTLITLLALSLPAQANEIDLLPYYDNAPPKVERVSTPAKAKPKPKKKKPVVRKAAPKPSQNTKVMAAEYRSEQVMRCIAPVRVVGSQDIREDAALESAKKAWAEIVRWESGEAWMDVNNAMGMKTRCGRSSIGEALGQVLNRCEIVASPCKPGMVEAGK